MHVAFIVNMRAGNFNGKSVWLNLKKQLTIPYTFFETKYAGHAKQLVTKIASSYDRQLIVVVGGDGTIHEVINGAIQYPHIIVGYVKGGSGNDFARAFPSFENGAEIEAFISKQQMKTVDCGVITYNEQQKKYFINNFGIGFDAFVCELANESSVKKAFNKFGLGKLSYAVIVVQAMLKFKPFTLTVMQEDRQRVYENVWFATVSNQPYFGGGMNLSPQSLVDDGLLEVTVVSNLARLKFLTLFLTVFKAKHTMFKEVEQFQGEAISFTTDRLTAIHTDGENEALTSHTIHCEINPQSIIIAK